MKIAVYHNLSPGGAKRAVYEEIKSLSSKHELDLYRLSSTNESFLDIREYFENTYSYDFAINLKARGIVKRLEKDFRILVFLDMLHKKIANDIDKLNYDICVVHPDECTQAPFLLKYLKTPTLYFCEEYLRIVYEKELEFDENVVFYKSWYENFMRRVRKRIDRDNARAAKKVLANSLFTKKNIEKAYNIKAEICHLGVDVDMFKRTSKKRGNYILIIGEKNLIGGSELIRNLAKIMRGGIKVKTLGFSRGKLAVTDDKMLSKEYSEALSTLCTSYNEPFGLPAIESMACGTPVLAVNEGGYKESVVDGATGYLLPRDPKVFAEKIEFLMNNPDIVERMGKAGREHVKKNFTWEKHVKCVEKQLIEIVKHGKKRDAETSSA